MWFFGLVGIIFVAVYTLLFTGFGNGIVKPILETEIQKQTHLPSHLTKFSLDMSSIDILLELNNHNTIGLHGSYSLFSQSFDLEYNVDLQELATLEPLTQKKLNDSFATDGTIKGDSKLLTVKGVSDVAKSNTTYKVLLREFNPSTIIANVNKLSLSSLLHLLGEKKYADGLVNLALNFKDITPHKLDGDVKLVTEDGVIDSKVMKKDFNITLPKTNFAMNLDAKLKGDNVAYKYALLSNLAKITSDGNVVPEPLKLDLVYALNIKELGVLKPIINSDLQGPLHLDGDVKGTKEKLIVQGKSDIADSKTSFEALLSNFAPKSAKVDIKSLQLQKLLYMLKQPHYADGSFNMKADITNADIKHLTGDVSTSVTKGKVVSSVMTKEFKFESAMPKTSFQTKTLTKIEDGVADTALDVVSTLANLKVKSAKYFLKDGTLTSDYRIDVADLDKLFFATQRHLKGNFSGNGDVKKAKDLDVTFHSDIARGKVDAKLHNDDFHADINKLQTLDILDMLLYPKIFDANLDAKMDYNLVKEKGKFDGYLSNGKFTKNQVLDLTKQYAKIDLYKQRFKGDVAANIKKENIVASLDLRSNTSSIITKNTYLNSKTQEILSKIDINANGNPLSVKLSGNAQSPKVEINADKLLKKEATKAASKELEKHLGKDASKLLQGLF
jgi:hypothetical protein